MCVCPSVHVTLWVFKHLSTLSSYPSWRSYITYVGRHVASHGRPGRLDGGDGAGAGPRQQHLARQSDARKQKRAELHNRSHPHGGVVLSVMWCAPWWCLGGQCGCRGDGGLCGGSPKLGPIAGDRGASRPTVRGGGRQRRGRPEPASVVPKAAGCGVCARVRACQISGRCRCRRRRAPPHANLRRCSVGTTTTAEATFAGDPPARAQSSRASRCFSPPPPAIELHKSMGHSWLGSRGAGRTRLAKRRAQDANRTRKKKQQRKQQKKANNKQQKLRRGGSSSPNRAVGMTCRNGSVRDETRGTSSPNPSVTDRASRCRRGATQKPRCTVPLA